MDRTIWMEQKRLPEFPGLTGERTTEVLILGCALKWNSREHSWDCSCHGSRFSEEGKLLSGPASADLPDTGQREGK